MPSNLIERLTATQEAMGWNDEEIARRVGIKLRMWQLLKSGSYRLSKRSLGLIVIGFPGLRPDVLAYLMEEVQGAEVEQESLAA